MIDTSSRSLIGMIVGVIGEPKFASFRLASEILGILQDRATNYTIALPALKALPDQASRLDVRKRAGKEYIYIAQANTSFIETILCCFRAKRASYITQSEAGPIFGKTDGNKLWELRGAFEEEWHIIEARIEEIIRRTPTESRFEAPPTVMLHGFLVGKAKTLAVPTVLITSSSMPYAVQLQKAILRNRALEASSFKVMTLNSPIEKLDAMQETEDV